MIVNITGSFLIGLIMTLLTERLQPHPYWRIALVVGFLGGYTTFSSFEWEHLLRRARRRFLDRPRQHRGLGRAGLRRRLAGCDAGAAVNSEHAGDLSRDFQG